MHGRPIRWSGPSAVDGVAETDGTIWDGERPSAVLLVPGFLAWRGLPEIRCVAESLAGDHDVLAIDVLGHGETKGRFSWGREEWRQVLAASEFLAQRHRSVAAVGFSFGGFHSALAAAQGAPLDRLVLVGSPVDLRVLSPRRFGRNLVRHLPAILRRRRYWARSEWPRPLRFRPLGPEILGRIRSASLVVHSEADWLVGKRHAEALVHGIPGARLLVIPRGLHAEYLIHSEQKALFLQKVREFLAPGFSAGPAGGKEGEPGPSGDPDPEKTVERRARAE